jgi:hypothetical protein
MEWLMSNYPKAMKLDDYSMYGRDFPPEVVEYVHAHWIRTGEVYTRPLNEIRKEVKITNLTVLTPEEAEARQKDNTVIKATATKPSQFLAAGMDETNKAALRVMQEKGPEKAAEFMMSNAGGDYALMRSMYG